MNGISHASGASARFAQSSTFTQDDAPLAVIVVVGVVVVVVVVVVVEDVEDVEDVVDMEGALVMVPEHVPHMIGHCVFTISETPGVVQSTTDWQSPALSTLSSHDGSNPVTVVVVEEDMPHVPQSRGQASRTNGTTHASALAGHSPPKFSHAPGTSVVVVGGEAHTPSVSSAGLVFPPEMHVPSEPPVLSALLQPQVYGTVPPVQSLPHTCLLHRSSTVVRVVATVEVDDAGVDSAVVVGQVPHITGHSSRATEPTNSLVQSETSLHSPILSGLPLQTVTVAVAVSSTAGSGVEVVVVVVVVMVVVTFSAMVDDVHKSGHVSAILGPIIVLVQNATTNRPVPHGSVVVVVVAVVVVEVSVVDVVDGATTVMVPTIQG